MEFSFSLAKNEKSVQNSQSLQNTFIEEKNIKEIVAYVNPFQ